MPLVGDMSAHVPGDHAVQEIVSAVALLTQNDCRAGRNGPPIGPLNVRPVSGMIASALAGLLLGWLMNSSGARAEPEPQKIVEANTLPGEADLEPVKKNEKKLGVKVQVEPPELKVDFTTAPVPEPAPIPVSKGAPASLSKMISVMGNTTEIAMPIDGNLEGMKTFTWASSPVVVVKLPNALSKHPLGIHNIDRGGVDRILIRDRNDKTQLFVFLNRSFVTYKVVQTGKILRIRLKYPGFKRNA